ncbi:hypothetical protein A176_001302 [Myxococcus hansupus]|uniref:SnoaL-like domain-containing protein n=1 Tax=Pseudomyxococcus hansupus TaxID=1297742 RepID=A0A0H4WSQ3_9BACT|nr:ketosteroid isomerase [Myxococcus hansupus]AKQ64390.1 hypothetical protein A176_001302 [Myxococcus hansupus]
MRHIRTLASFIPACVLALLVSVPGLAGAADTDLEAANTALVKKAFEDWKHGRGSVFDLLSERAEWVVAGSSPVSGVYRSRDEFMKQAVNPITARLSTPIVPEVRHILTQGEHVVVFWEGRATARDGSLYKNSYAWHLVLEKGRVTRVVAFLDTWRLHQLMK